MKDFGSLKDYPLIDTKIAVVRDPDGFYSHPEIPDFDESQADYKKWLAAQRLATSYSLLYDEDEDHPALKRWNDEAFSMQSSDEEMHVRDWNRDPPALPDGTNNPWFIFSIHDTEDGPVWVWARLKHAWES